MSDKVEAPQVPAGTPAPEQAQQTPEAKVYAGKFKEADALYKGANELRKKLDMPEMTYADPDSAEREYTSLQKLMGKMGQAKQADKLAIPDAKPVDDNMDVPDILQKASLDQSAIEKKWAEKGTLDPEDYEALRKVNPALSKNVVNRIAEGLAAKAALTSVAKERLIGEAATIVGGQEQLDALLTSAREFVPETEIEAFNKRLDDPKQMLSAVRELAFLQSQRTQTRQTVIQGGTARSTAGAANVDEARAIARELMSGNFSRAEKLQRTSPEILSKMME